MKNSKGLLKKIKKMDGDDVRSIVSKTILEEKVKKLEKDFSKK